MPTKIKKIEKKIKVMTCMQTEFEGRLEDVIERLKAFSSPTTYPQYHRFEISDISRWDETDLCLFGVRWETDKERDKRAAANIRVKENKARKKQEKEEDERRQYEKLKKKFKGNKNGK